MPPKKRKAEEARDLAATKEAIRYFASEEHHKMNDLYSVKKLSNYITGNLAQQEAEKVANKTSVKLELK